jgi:cytochrome c oxidase subunit 2
MKIWEIVALLLVVLALALPFSLLSMDKVFSSKNSVVIRAYITEAGGFKPNLIVVERGQKIRIVVESMDVVHGFAIPSLGINSLVDVGGKRVIEFVAEKRGVYFFGCSIRCSPYHFFMGGIIVVK